MLGLPVINGWGLTETSPVLSCRPVWPRENVRGTVGLPMAGTQVRVVDPDTRQPLPEGAKVGPVAAASPPQHAHLHLALVLPPSAGESLLCMNDSRMESPNMYRGAMCWPGK